MAVDVDNDTLQACIALWQTDAVNLPALFDRPPQAGRLIGPQRPPYAAVSCEKSREPLRMSAGVRIDYRKATITLRGDKARVSKGLGFVLALFNAQLGAPGKPTLTYPSAANGMPQFIAWWPLNEGELKQDPDVKAGDDVWIGLVEAEVRARGSIDMADQQQPPARQFDVEAFRKEFNLALNIAEGVRAPTKTPAVAHLQAGQEILVARCPHCGSVAALSGPGKHLCRGCQKWLEYEKVG